MIDQIGQLFIIGYEGARPSSEFLEFIESENIGGVILFEKNCTHHTVAEENIRKIISTAREVPFIAVDQEGGRVCRFRGAPAEYASAEEYGRHNNLELFQEQFNRAAFYIRSLGINLILAPVADLNINRNNLCLAGRTFGSSPARVNPFIESAVRLANKAGLLSCLKHFPGLGAASDDPHRQVARSDYDLQTFLNREALTFKTGIDAGADMVMTTHMLLPNIDKLLTTESEMILQLLLRDKLNFDGIAITDDLLMKGADELGNYGERALKAFNAGHDILLFGQNFLAVKEAVGYIKDACKNGKINEDRLELSLNRISGVKSKLAVSAL
jgi:beta-N-acetylhexosaminidase